MFTGFSFCNGGCKAVVVGIGGDSGTLRLRGTSHQVANAQQIVSGRGKGEDPAHLLQSPMPIEHVPDGAHRPAQRSGGRAFFSSRSEYTNRAICFTASAAMGTPERNEAPEIAALQEPLQPAFTAIASL